jgi:type I restriction enzyme S subunit
MKDLEKQAENIFSKTDKSDWEFFKFGDIAFNISERVEPNDTKLEVYVGLEHLDPDSIHIRRTGVPSDVEGTKLKVYKGDIIFGKRRAYQRKAAIATFDGICSAHSMVLRANPETIEPALFPFFIHSDVFMNRAVDISEGSLSPTIKWKILSEQKFRLPPWPLQKKLAELLWAVDEENEKIRNTDGSFDTFKSVFLERVLFSGKGDSLKLEDIGEVVRGVGYKPEDVGIEYSNTHYPILRSNNIQAGEIRFDDLYYINNVRIKKHQLLKDKDIVICMSNGSKELVGKAAEFVEYKNPISFGSFCAVFRPSEKYKNIAKYLFQTISYRKHIQLLLTGTNINNLKPSDIESITFNISVNALSERMSEQLNSINQFQQKLFVISQNIKNISKTLITKIFSI